MIFNLIIILLVQVISGWSPYIHLLTVRASQRRISPQSLKRLTAIVSEPRVTKTMPAMNDLTSSSIWADYISSPENKESRFKVFSVKDWHFTKVKITLDEKDSLKSIHEKISGPDNVYDNDKNAAYLLECVMKEWTKSHSLWYKNVLLRLFIHVFTDIHQPLHASDFQLKDVFPEGDNGGTRWVFKKGFFYRTLHKLWDTAGGIYRGKARLWYPERDGPISNELSNLLEQDVDDLSPPAMDTLTNWTALEEMPFEDFRTFVLDQNLIRQIIQESSIVAKTKVYQPLEHEGTRKTRGPSIQYVKDTQIVSKDLISTSSRRMAVFLNQFGKN